MGPGLGARLGGRDDELGCPYADGGTGEGAYAVGGAGNRPLLNLLNLAWVWLDTSNGYAVTEEVEFSEEKLGLLVGAVEVCVPESL